jgi:AcrR family transcriptional regulator
MNRDPETSQRVSRRQESAQETRRRIVEATFALHEEQGVAATSMRHIAERAGVSIGSVYHHFPTYEDAILACGAHADEKSPAPTLTILEGGQTSTERVERMVSAFFDWYGQLPVLERIRCDKDRIPLLRDFVRAGDDNRHVLARAALQGHPKRDAHAPVLASILDIAVYRNLRDCGLGRDEAVRAVCAMLFPWLAGSDTSRSPPHDEV